MRKRFLGHIGRPPTSKLQMAKLSRSCSSLVLLALACSAPSKNSCLGKYSTVDSSLETFKRNYEHLKFAQTLDLLLSMMTGRKRVSMFVNMLVFPCLLNPALLGCVPVLHNLWAISSWKFHTAKKMTHSRESNLSGTWVFPKIMVPPNHPFE